MMCDPKVILVSDASAGIGRLAAHALAHSGHTVYAAIPDAEGLNRRQPNEVRSYAREQGVDLRPIQLDITSGASVDDAIAAIIEEHRRIDVLLNNSPQPIFGPAEAFTPDQISTAFERNIVGTQRLMRAALPHLRRRPESLLVWVVSSASAGGSTPYLAFYCAMNAALEAIAVQYARELARWGVETSIIVPGVFSTGLSPLQNMIEPGDTARAAEYHGGPYFGFERILQDRAAQIVPADAIPGAAAGAIVMVVDTPFGERPFRVTVDPTRDGAEVVFSVMDRVRDEMIRRLGLSDLLRPWRVDATERSESLS